MKQVLLPAIIALLFALNAGAQTKTVHLPTTAYRTEGSNEIKVNYTYDTNGRVASEYRYIKRDGNYILVDSIARAYHKLPNGKFVNIKNETKRKNIMPEFLGRDPHTGEFVFSNEYHYDVYSHGKETAAYDNKGMQLWEQTESHNTQWAINSREEAVVNGSGIRTGIRRYNYNTEQLELDNGYTFDAKGRVTGYSYERDEYDDSQGTVAVTYTWGANDMLNSCTETYRGGEDVDYLSQTLFNNITTVLNGEYFEPYSLSPFVLGMRYDDSGNISPWERSPLPFTDMQKYAWDDYTLRQWFFNADASANQGGEELSATWRTVVDNAKGEITMIFSIGSSEARKEVYEKLPYGGYKYSAIENGDTTDIRIKEYNQYGAIIRDYSYEYEAYEDDDYMSPTEYEYDKQYNREYDAQGRPVKTVYSYRSKYNDGDYYTDSQFEETYDAWTTAIVEAPTSIYTPKSGAASTVLVYPNPVTDMLYIKAENPQSKLYNQQGQLLLQTNEAQITFSSYPTGIYILDVNGERMKVVKK